MLLQQGFQAYCAGLGVDVNSQSNASTIRILADMQLLESSEYHLPCIREFRAHLVDIIEAVKERLCGSRSCTLPIAEEKECELDVLMGRASVFLSVVVTTYPNTRHHIRKVLIETYSCRGNVVVDGESMQYKVAPCVINLQRMSRSSREEAANYMFALRCLALHGCLGDMTESALDLGALVERSTSSSSGAKTSWGEYGALYSSFTLLCLLMNVPHQTSLTSFAMKAGHDVLGEMLFVEAQHVAACYHARGVGDNAAFEAVKQWSSRTELLYRPFDQDTLHLGGYSLVSQRGATEQPWAPRMVKTVTSLRNCQHLMQAIQSSLPIIVQGAVGCGKSFILRELAGALGQERTLMELQLDDQTDAKSLIGSYVCSDVPGEFVWHAGIVTQAALQGHWLVIENIDRAPFDILAALAPLLEKRKLYLPNGGGEVSAHPCFRLIGTRTLSTPTPALQDALPHNLSSAMVVPSMRHFAHYWMYVNIDVPLHHEISLILDARFPHLLPSVKQLLIRVYQLFSNNNNENAISSVSDSDDQEKIEDKDTNTKEISTLLRNSRQFTLRDLMKVAGRCERYKASFNHESDYLTDRQRKDLLNEVVDVFAASSRSEQQYRELVCHLGATWGVSLQEVESHVINGFPQIEEHGEKISIGRGSVARTQSLDSVEGGQQFAFTRHSLRVLERIAVCVSMDEPVLLVGETGSGKTTSVQELANLSHRKLVVQNLSLSTDSSDLLGGFRPVTMRQLFHPTYVQFVQLFQDTFSSSNNAEYLHATNTFMKKQQWKRLLKAFLKASVRATGKLREDLGKNTNSVSKLLAEWLDFELRVKRIESNLPRIEFGFAFAFVEGQLVESMRNGHWILLDEINLATPETLQGIAGILDGQSLCLSERGDIEPVPRHPDFRVFAAMNPPTDVGKKELPAALRTRFTEFYVAEMTDPTDLASVVDRYLQNVSNAPVAEIVRVYLESRDESEKTLVDSGGQRPRYSTRSLTRSLQAAKSFLGLNIRPLNRALLEGFLLNFQTLLGDLCREKMRDFLTNGFGMHSGKEGNAPPSRPGGKGTKDKFALVGPFWLHRGPLDCVDWADRDEESGITRFVLTKTVENSIRDLAAAVAAGVAPVLLQGPTSVGKTTMIEYLASRTGHQCVRINNHEHTDVQEYIGGYVTNSSGQLEFRDGLLVDALRNGHWIILDELNLAPSDVLEALNRLLDDNKELFIPETGETVRPAHGFTLFATQNPPGAYGGRKPLSRAFRNRFLELSICDLPGNEVEEIVSHSCGLPLRYSKMLVQVMNKLQMQRSASSVFQGKHGNITMRDLIKWGRRKPHSPLEVAEEGYMLIAEKLRGDAEKGIVVKTLNSICKVDMDPSTLYVENQREDNMPGIIGEEGHFRQGRDDLLHLQKVQHGLRSGELQVEGIRGVAITDSIKRMWRLVGRCIAHNEPVLLIGETGSGKTTVCQLYAAHRKQAIHILNCHQSTETADIIGGLRPVRGRENVLTEVVSGISEALELLNILPNKLFTENKAEFCSAAEIVSTNTQISEENVKRAVDSLAKLVGPAANNTNGSTSNKRARPISDENPVNDDNMDADDEGIQRLEHLSNQCSTSWMRSKALFEWKDGPLVQAMRNGDIFVMDEINLADDAVIERLNSVLESGRTITLAEKGGAESERIIAHPDFKFLATMNPGGDFGKRELSAALRSRFTEFYVPAVTSSTDLETIIVEIIRIDEPSDSQKGTIPALAAAMVSFMNWLNEQATRLSLPGIAVTVREVLAWARFVSQSKPQNEGQAWSAVLHGAHMVLLDGLGLGLAIERGVVTELRTNCVKKLLDECPEHLRAEISSSLVIPFKESVQRLDNKFRLGTFSIPLGNNATRDSAKYVLNAESTITNLHRILRAMQLPRPLLLEGPPGVGKTTIISNLATLSGHELVRINLSEHSDIADLLGTDLPAPDDGKNGDSSTKFVWCDGVFLEAMKAGHWVLLDELNLAPQSVLEGLNACFDHREEVFLPELGRSYRCPPTFRVFCAQNPMIGGGGRKGLPQSFLTRFSRVYVEAMTEVDMQQIASGVLQASQVSIPAEVQLKSTSETMVSRFASTMVRFVRRLQEDFADSPSHGRQGAPWEFNLRDIFRWCELTRSMSHLDVAFPKSDHTKAQLYLVSHAANILFAHRVRDMRDRECVNRLFEDVFGSPLPEAETSGYSTISMGTIRVGAASLPCASTFHYPRNSQPSQQPSSETLPLHGGLAFTFEALAHAVVLSWPVLLVAPSGSGKRTVLRHLANQSGRSLREFSASSSTDATDLLGSFEQADGLRTLRYALSCVEQLAEVMFTEMMVNWKSRQRLVSKLFSGLSRLHHNLEILSQDPHADVNATRALRMEMSNLLNEVEPLLESGEASNQPRIRALCDRCHTLLDKRRKVGGFEWVDGLVVRAAESGDWLLIDNVNLCNASVLDRLNSLMEPNGTLLLSECGSGREIHPHPNFRIFFTMDPGYGEISRAMRNRCVELALIPESDVASAAATARKQVPSALQEDLMDMYQRMYDADNPFPSAVPRHKLFSRALSLLESELQIGEEAESAIKRAVRTVFPPLTRQVHTKNDRSLMTPTNFLDASVLPSRLALPVLLMMLYPRDEPCDLSVAGKSSTPSWLKGSFADTSTALSLSRLDELADIDTVALRSEMMAEILRTISHQPDWARFLLYRMFSHPFLADMSERLQHLVPEAIHRAHAWEASVLAGTCGQTALSDITFSAREMMQSKLASFAGVSGCMSSDLAIPTPSYLLDVANRWWRLGEITFFSRLSQILRESEERSDVHAAAPLHAGSHLPSLFGLAVAISQELMPADSKDRLFLLRVFRVIEGVDALISSLLKTLCEEGTGTKALELMQDEFETSIKILQKHRDSLAVTLLDETVTGSQAELPWDHLLICVRWLSKAVNKLSKVSLVQASPLPEWASKHCSPLMNEMEVLNVAVGDYWERPVYKHKIRLWKEGGHASVPSSKQSWKILLTLENALESDSATDVKLPSFIDGTIPVSRVRLEGLPHRKLSMGLLKDWLSLLCTFYFAETPEVPVENPNGRKLNLASLASAMSDRIQAHKENRSFNADDISTVDEGGTGTSEFYSRALEYSRVESQKNSEAALALLVEPALVDSLLRVSEQLAVLVSHGANLNVDLIKRFSGWLRRSLQLSLRHGVLEPRFLRQLQSLSWSVDAIIDAEIVSDAAKNAFAHLSRAVLYSIDSAIYGITSRSLSDLAGAIDCSYSSRFYSAALDTRVDQEGQEVELPNIILQRTVLQQATSGTLSQLQPSRLHTVLLHADIRAQVSCAVGNVARAIASPGSASLSVSSCGAARRRLLQMVRLFGATNATEDACVALARPHLLLRLALDIVLSCRDFYENDKREQLLYLAATVCSQLGTANSVFLAEVCGKLKQLQLHASCKGSAMSDLLLNCVEPVWDLLSSAAAWNATDSRQMAIPFGRAWALIGTAQMHLVLPALPVDPAVKASVKASVLNGHVRKSARAAVSQMSLGALGGSHVPAQCARKFVEDAVTLEERCASLRSRAVERPAESAPFSSVFFELRDGVDSLASMDIIISLIDRFYSAYEKVLKARVANAASDALAELRSVVREEISWQGNALAFADRIAGSSLRTYSDICSPLMSGLQHISSGLRIICGLGLAEAEAWNAKVDANENVKMQKMRGSDDTAEFWTALMQYPYSTKLALAAADNRGEDLCNSALGDIEMLLRGQDIVVSAVQRHLDDSRDAQNAESQQSGVLHLPPSDSVCASARANALLLVLAKIDYYVGGGTLQSSKAIGPFFAVLNAFVESQLRAEEKRIARQKEKDALYRSKQKAQESTYEDNEEKEERKALREHFPNHLKEYRDIIESSAGVEGQELLNDLDADLEVEDTDAATGMLELADAEFESHVMTTLIGYHARMVFLHLPNELMKQCLMWRRSGTRLLGGGVVDISLRGSMLSALRQHTLSTACSINWSLIGQTGTGLSHRCQAGTLAALASMVDVASVGSAVSADQSALTGCVEGLDRDLLLLLLDDKITGSWRPRNFHVDPCPAEAARISGPLRSLLDRCASLLEQFPDHEQLLQISRLAIRISNLHVSTPIGKLLVSVQLLYQRASEWEQFAASHVSLKPEMATLASLVARWRDLELASWDALLRGKELQFANRTLQQWTILARLLRDVPHDDPNYTKAGREESYWKRLKKALGYNGPMRWVGLIQHSPAWLLHGPRTPSFSSDKAKEPSAAIKVEPEQTDVDGTVNVWGKDAIKLHKEAEEALKSTNVDASSYLQSVFDILDSYFRKSCMGEFPMRLHLVRLFAVQLELEVLTLWESFWDKHSTDLQDNQNEYSRISLLAHRAHLVFGIWQYYAQFLPMVRKQQQQQLDPILTRVRAEVKMGKWDQMSAYSLLAHSEKAHAKLNKLMRQYQQEVLQQPIVAILQSDLMSNMASEQGDLQSAAEVPGPSTFFPRLVEIENGGASGDLRAAMNADLPVVDPAEKSLDALRKCTICSSLTIEVAANSQLRRLPTLCKKADKYLHDLLVPAEMPTRSSGAAEDDQKQSEDEGSDAESENDGYSMKELRERFDGRLRYGLQAAEFAEDFCSQVFSRIESLRESDVPKAAKHRAVIDLLSGLKEKAGFSHLRSSVPNEQAETVSIMGTPAPLPCEVATDLMHTPSAPRDLLERGESYYIRNVAEILQLRAQIAAPSSPDITLREMQYMSGLSENAFGTALKLRIGIRAALSDHRSFTHAISQLESTMKANPSISANDYISRVTSVAMDNILQLYQLVVTAAAAHAPDAIEEDPAVVPLTVEELNKAQSAASHCLSVLKKLAAATSNAESLTTESICDLYGVLTTSQYHITADSAEELQSAQMSLEEVEPTLTTMVTAEVVAPVMASLKKLSNLISAELRTEKYQPVRDDVDAHAVADIEKCLDNCLTTVQRLRALGDSLDAEGALKTMFGGPSAPAPEETLVADTLQQQLSLSLAAVAALQPTHLIESLQKISGLVESTPSVLPIVDNLMPLIKRIQHANATLIEDLCLAYKAQGKLLYVSLRVFRVLLAKGLCSARTEDGDGEGQGDASGMNFEDDVEGTGMGEGDGKKDVSDQIENEEQLSGLKNDDKNDDEGQQQKPKDKLDKEEAETGVEMAQDFEGDMYDLPDEEDEEQDQDDKEDEEDLEREMGEADKEDIVDEKQWESEDEEGKDGEEGKDDFQKDSKSEGEQLEGETHTRGDDQDENEEGEDENARQDQKKEEQSPDDAMDIEDQQDKINEADDETEKPQGVDIRDNEEDKMESDGEENGTNEEMGGDGMDEQDLKDDEVAGDMPDDMQLDDGDGDEGEADDANDMDASNDEVDGDDDMNVDSDDDEPQQEENEGEANQEVMPISSAGGNEPEEQPNADDNSADEEEKEDDEEDSISPDTKDDDAKGPSKQPPAFGVNAGDKSGEAVLGTENDDNEAPPGTDAEGPQGSGAQSSGQGDTGDSLDVGGAATSSAPSQPPAARDKEPPNPFREEGDINEAWHRRLNMAPQGEEGKSEPEPEPQKNDTESADNNEKSNQGLYEFGNEEDKEQVLADASEEQSQLPKGAEQMPVENEEVEGDEADHADDSKEVKKRTRSEGTQELQDKETERKKQRQEDATGDNILPASDNNGGQQEDDLEAEVTVSDDEQAGLGSKITTNSEFKFNDDGKGREEDSEDDEGIMEVSNAEHTPGILDIVSSRQLWGRYRTSSDSHSMRLCEQLRLILEPTLATRLRGDYRSGKRINMRRVIGYVASGFRKDKIWLRRTKPAKREYQVMLMIDNSKSMGAAGPLALGALAAISGALTKLEVGDLCVCAFAEKVQNLHAFGTPFNDEAGAKVVSKLSFAEDTTRMGEALKAVTPIFEEAASSSMSAQSAICLQICFVISDAKLDSDNRERLDAIIRDMAERHILVVMIIIDVDANPADSVFNTKTVEFIDDKIVTREYMDNFPFPYYLAIQRLEALPETLSDALKQWFELIGSQIDNS